MLINAYDTTVGQVLKVNDRVDETIKTLVLMNNLTPTKKANVFVITQATPVPFSALAFPITLQDHTRRTITVYDERPYRDKQNRPVNTNDIAIMRLCAFLQQDVAELRFSPLKTARNMTAKAFAEALAKLLTRRVGLDISETSILKCLLVHYVVSLMEQPNTDLEMVSSNVIRSVFNMSRDFVAAAITDVPRMSTLSELLDAIRKNPALYKLKSLDLKDAIALVSSLTFHSLRGPVVGAASEAPCLMVAFVYGAARFRAYNKTAFGEAVEPKHNRDLLEPFLKNLDYTYDLSE